jgi:hypothetical protein
MGPCSFFQLIKSQRQGEIMRLIGGHDYYDSGLAWGQDGTLIFLRNEGRKEQGDDLEEVTGIESRVCSADFRNPEARKSNRYHSSYSSRHAFSTLKRKNDIFTFMPAHVILCGVLYSGILAKKQERLKYTFEDEHRWLWTPDAVRAYATEQELDLNEGQVGTAMRWKMRQASSEKINIEVQPLSKWMEPVKLEGKAMAYIIENRITIATRNPAIYRTSSDPRWDVDQDTLGAMEFAKMVDPYTAFQEISMWLGGVLPRQAPDIVEITDDRIKIEKHGFHHPTSFRKSKQS